MDNREILINLEKEIDLSVFTEDNIWLYPVIRQNLNVFVFQGIQSDSEKLSKTVLVKKILQSIKWHFKSQHFKKNDILIIDAANSKRLNFEGKYKSIYTEFISKLSDSFFTIERPSDLHDNHNSKISDKNVFYPDLHIFKIILKSKITNKKYKFLNSESFKLIKQTLNIEKNIERVITIKLNRFIEFVKFYEKILIKTKPKVIFIVCGYSYSNMALCYAAKKKSIPTIELQHGLINKSHTGYIYKNVISRQLFPDYFFSFGEMYTALIQKESQIFEENKIKSVGFPYIEDLKRDKIKGKKSIDRKIYITSQWTISSELKSFIESLSKLLPSGYKIIYKTHPRETNTKKFYESFNQLNNVELVSDPSINSLEIMNKVDIHSTVYSTSFMEAFYFELPNIFIEIQGYSDSIIKYIDNQTCYLVKTPGEYIEVLQKIEKQSDVINKKIKEKSQNFYKSQPFSNIQSELKKIINA